MQKSIKQLKKETNKTKRSDMYQFSRLRIREHGEDALLRELQ